MELEVDLSSIGLFSRDQWPPSLRHTISVPEAAGSFKAASSEALSVIRNRERVTDTMAHPKLRWNEVSGAETRMMAPK